MEIVQTCVPLRPDNSMGPFQGTSRPTQPAWCLAGSRYQSSAGWPALPQGCSTNLEAVKPQRWSQLSGLA